jgi:hypothetical protein
VIFEENPPKIPKKMEFVSGQIGQNIDILDTRKIN